MPKDRPSDPAALAILADENVDHAIVERLRDDGYDVVWIAETAPGIDDEGVLALANDQGRLLFTSDKDFGELVFRLGRITAGVVLLRLHGLSVDAKSDAVAEALNRHATEFAGAFTVISPESIRIRTT